MNLQSTADLLDRPTIDELDRIQQDIRRNLSLRVCNLRIQAFDEGLVLEGRTKTYYGKQLIQNAVMDTIDFPILANNIIVG